MSDTNVSTPPPIFLHALFRSGSTWLFQTFRRLGPALTCYQEPLHEVTLYAQEDRSILAADHDASKMQLLRHPQLAQSYFSELQQLPDASLQTLRKADIYDGYFSDTDPVAGSEFWCELIRQSPGRAVIQECRSAGRIRPLRQQLGGFHAYLWRNPHDQWWSYQVAPYFDTTSQLILNAAHPPALIQRLHTLLGFERFDHPNLHAQFDHFGRRPLPPEDAYRAFYALWLLALQQAERHADLLLNSDTLSVSRAEQERCSAVFAEHGVTGLDLSDCRVPASRFTESERARLQTLEDDVHQLWHDAGMDDLELTQLLELRQQHEPGQQAGRSSIADIEQALTADLGRYRDLLWRQQQRIAELSQQHNAEQAHLHAHAGRLQEERDHQAEVADSRMTHIAELERALAVMLNSRSWRLTEPLRQGAARLGPWRQRSREQLASWRRAMRPRLINGLERVLALIRNQRQLRIATHWLSRRFPTLQRKIRQLRHTWQSETVSANDQSVMLHPRSQVTYRKLTAAIEARRSGDQQPTQGEGKH